MIRKIWRSIWFMDDDDRTPQGKLARGTFYLFYTFLGFMIVFGVIVPVVDHSCGSCWSEARKNGPFGSKLKETMGERR